MAPCAVTCLVVLAALSQIMVFVAASSLPTVTPRPDLRRGGDLPDVLDKRQANSITTQVSTCGYLNGDPSGIRTANSGYDCRVDTANGLWGFCPTTVIAATDCGLAGFCQDSGTCSDVCGSASNPDLTTFTCGSSSFCSTALLTFGVDQTYAYIACGGKAATDHYDISPTASTSSTSTSSTTSSASSSTSSSSQPSTSSTATPSSGGGSSNTGAIVGGVLGGLVLIGIFAVVVIVIMRFGKRSGRNESSGESSSARSGPLLEMKNGGWARPSELPDPNTSSGLLVELPGSYS